ncbi:MAG: Triosephosphate isomerase [Gammaproteobacteria bacterium]|nr:Triosephosphate isomerase [Gammaproteobacteria bacterium]
MHGDRARGAELVEGIVARLDAVASVEVVICPPAVLIPHVFSRIAGTPIGLGGQNLCDRDEGAFTGEVSGPMLADAGCAYCIIGHSERRAYYGETSEVVAGKFEAALRSGLIPILCVGETLEERDAGKMESVIAAQLDTVVNQVGVNQFARAIVAYEPVWAIGTGRTATPEQAQDAHRFIRERIGTSNPDIAERLRILYGGSVKPENADGLFAQTDIDGGLIGGASLKADRFLAICTACTNA